MPDANSTKTLPQSYVLLDTNILQYLNNSTIAKELISYLTEINKTGYSFAISDFSIFELLAGVPKSHEKALVSTLEVLPRFAVTAEVMITAAQLTTVYRMEKAEYQHIGDGDKIIAATSILGGHPILTANVNDFPRPCFTELHKKLTFYKEKSRDRMLVVYLLYPDFDLFQFRYTNRP